MSYLAQLVGGLAMVVLGTLGPIGSVHATGAPAALVPTGFAAHLVYPWRVTDGPSSPGAFCTYDDGHPRRRVFVPVRMPRIYWPDTHPGRTDSGTVGWQIELQVAPSPSGPWRIAYRSSITTGTATQDGAAGVAKHAINWRVLRGRAWYRVIDRAIWYRSDGSLLTTRVHLIGWYRLARARAPWDDHSVGGWDIGRMLGVRHHSCPRLI